MLYCTKDNHGFSAEPRRFLLHLFCISCSLFFDINLYAFNICDTLKHNGFVIDFIDFIYVLSSIYVIEI